MVKFRLACLLKSNVETLLSPIELEGPQATISLNLALAAMQMARGCLRDRIQPGVKVLICGNSRFRPG